MRGIVASPSAPSAARGGCLPLLRKRFLDAELRMRIVTSASVNLSVSLDLAVPRAMISDHGAVLV